MQIRHNCLILYLRPDTPNPNKKPKIKRPAYSGNMNKGSKKRLTRAMENLIQHTEKKWILNPCLQKHHTFTLSFMTLTIPPDRLILADEGYPILKRFLRNAERVTRQNTGLKSYLWKGELQEQTGQLHYHLASNNFLRMDLVQQWWNKELKKEGLLNGHAKRFGNFNPPSTQITGPLDHDAMGYYLTKYISKDTQNFRSLNGKVWDCSTDLKSKLFSQEIDQYSDYRIQRALKSGTAEKIERENCVIIKSNKPLELIGDKTLNEYKNWLKPNVPILQLQAN